ncbi:MFS general substrate transporter [Colletotrichum zoysiae]|uniref:MFS general substrate transporter n=1 Tax=Colletotrichum zoysiae TaxID=1216348 RepID=A0AAD9H7J6_9PEZI|nr:MFS general substrate transporter [Colletotrichum zoysiae]
MDDFPTGFALAMIVSAVIMSFFLVSLDMTIVATAIPKITDDFHGLADVSWYSSAFFMTTAGFQSTWGKAYKYFPIKITFLVSISIFELGSLLCGAAPASSILIIGRAITGVGGAGIGSGCYTLIGFAVQPSKRPMLTGLVGTSYGIASVLGPLLGGVLSNKASWRWCFYINLPIGAVSIAAILYFFKTPAAARPQEASFIEKTIQMDPLGTVIIMGAVVSLILAFQKGGQTDPWTAPTVIGLLISSVVLTGLFVGWETFQGERATIVPRLFRQRTVFFCFIFLIFIAGGYYTAIYNLPQYFQAIHGTSPIESGVRNLPFIISVSVASIATGSFVSWTRIAVQLMPIGAIISTVSGALFCTLGIKTEPAKWIGYQILAGMGFGMCIQLPMIICQSSVDITDLASITAIMMFSQAIGAAVIVSAAQTAFANILIQRVRTSAPDVSPEALITVGSGQLRKAFRPDQIPGILVAYMSGVTTTFIVVAGAGAFAFISSTYIPWKRLNHGKGQGAATSSV